MTTYSSFRKQTVCHRLGNRVFDTGCICFSDKRVATKCRPLQPQTHRDRSTLFSRFLSIALFTLIHVMLNGCTHQQLVSERYPGWGEEVLLDLQDQTTPLHLRLLMPRYPADAPACLLIVHGMNEHVGRYADTARHFANRFIVGGVDLRGHGLSNPTLFAADRAIANGAKFHSVSDAYLEQAVLRNLEPMRRDLDQALHYLLKRCDASSISAEPRPLFILSHSLGSLVTATYILANDQSNDARARVKGIIFTGPGFSVTKVPGWRGWLQNPIIDFTFYTHEHFLSPHDEPLPLMIANQLTALVTVPLQDSLIEIVSLPGMRSLFTPTTPDWIADYLTDWEDEKARHRADGYIIRKTILRYILGVEKEIIDFRRAMANFDVPYLLIYSEHDAITPAWGNLEFAAVTQHRHRDNQLLRLKNKRHHEQLFSAPPLREKILQDIGTWLDRRIKDTRNRKYKQPFLTKRNALKAR